VQKKKRWFNALLKNYYVKWKRPLAVGVIQTRKAMLFSVPLIHHNASEAPLDWMAVWHYLGETNLFNVLVLVGIVVFFFKWKNINIGKGLDAKIKETVIDLESAETLSANVLERKEDVLKALSSVEKDRQKRLHQAEERAEEYSRKLVQETQAKIRKLTERQHAQKRLESNHLQRDMVQNFVSSLDALTVERLKEGLDQTTQVRLIHSALSDIQALYTQGAKTSAVSTSPKEGIYL
jgi:F-type H+-transporting ATPase subunit b